MTQQMRAVMLTVCALTIQGCVGGVLFGPPVIDTVRITPDPATANDTLTCEYDGFAGGADLSDVFWTINGEDAGSELTLTGGFVMGDAVSCTVTPSNGKRDGVAVSTTVTIDNAPPILSAVTLRPSNPTSSETLNCEHSGATDVDGTDTFTYRFSWTINGNPISATGDALGPEAFERNDEVQCHVIASDGESDSATESSNAVEIENSAPTISGLAIDPPSPLEDDTLSCDYTQFVDADGDPDQSDLEWSINGVAAGNNPILNSGYEAGDVVTCTVVPFDGLEEGEEVTVSVTVLGVDDCDDDGDGYWTPSWARFECEVLDETNYYRSIGYDCDTKGYFGATTPLEMQHNLRKAARYHSQWMSDTGIFSHDSPGGPYGDDFVERLEWAGYTGWRLVGENIAAGQTSPAAVVLAWMESDGHCKNIMNPEFNELGVGYFYDSGSKYRHWWSQEFGKR